MIPKRSLYAAGSTASWRLWVGKAFEWACFAATLLCVAVLLVLIAAVVYEAIPALRLDFLTQRDSNRSEEAGIFSALIGSLWVIGLTIVFAVPTGVAAAVYMEEYAVESWWVSLIRTNIANLAGVPSIVYGLLGLAVFVYWLQLGRSVLAGALTLALVILPIIIIASQEALRAVPQSLRHAAFALGATRWQVVWHQVLPAATPGIATGVILALSRALGEAAPLIAVGAVGFMNYTPTTPLDQFTVLPVQIYNWTEAPPGAETPTFISVAAAGIVVMMAILLAMNAVAVFVRNHFSHSARH